MTKAERKKLFNYLVKKDNPQYDGNVNMLDGFSFSYYLQQTMDIVLAIDESIKDELNAKQG